MLRVGLGKRLGRRHCIQRCIQRCWPAAACVTLCLGSVRPMAQSVCARHGATIACYPRPQAGAIQRSQSVQARPGTALGVLLVVPSSLQAPGRSRNVRISWVASCRPVDGPSPDPRAAAPPGRPVPNVRISCRRAAGIMAPASRVLGDVRSPGRCIAAASTRAAARGFCRLLGDLAQAPSRWLGGPVPGTRRVACTRAISGPVHRPSGRSGGPRAGPTPGESPADDAGRGCRIMVR